MDSELIRETRSSILNSNSSAVVINLLNKSDLLEKKPGTTNFGLGFNGDFISCISLEGFESFVGKLAESVSKVGSQSSDQEAIFINERHQAHLQELDHSLEKAILHATRDASISAFYVREAINQIGAITGHITTDDILDVLFKDFCIGK